MLEPSGGLEGESLVGRGMDEHSFWGEAFKLSVCLSGFEKDRELLRNRGIILALNAGLSVQEVLNKLFSLRKRHPSQDLAHGG